MAQTTSISSVAYNSTAIGEAIDDITAGLERVTAGFINLKSLLVPTAVADTAEFDPKDPANKHEIGGLMKLTSRGAEICFRLFDAGKSRYAVASLMDISFGAVTHRHEAWKKLGGANRTKQLLD
jgi:DNA-binding NarL/FixJ family response regulator